jgi:hypothetical protein
LPNSNQDELISGRVKWLFEVIGQHARLRFDQKNGSRFDFLLKFTLPAWTHPGPE